MERNLDRIYGNGFRRAKEAWTRLGGLVPVLKFVKANSALPK